MLVLCCCGVLPSSASRHRHHHPTNCTLDAVMSRSPTREQSAALCVSSAPHPTTPHALPSPHPRAPSTGTGRPASRVRTWRHRQHPSSPARPTAPATPTASSSPWPPSAPPPPLPLPTPPPSLSSTTCLWRRTARGAACGAPPRRRCLRCRRSCRRARPLTRSGPACPPPPPSSSAAAAAAPMAAAAAATTAAAGLALLCS